MKKKKRLEKELVAIQRKMLAYEAAGFWERVRELMHLEQLIWNELALIRLRKRT